MSNEDDRYGSHLFSASQPPSRQTCWGYRDCMKGDAATGCACSATQPTSAYNCDAEGAIGVGADNGVSGGGGRRRVRRRQLSRRLLTIVGRYGARRVVAAS